MFFRRKQGIAIICIVLAAAGGLFGVSLINKPAEKPVAPAVSKAKTPTKTLAAHVDASVKAFDSANAISDPAWFTQAYEAGFRLYVIQTVNFGTCDPWPQVQPQIAAALAAGLKVAAYTRDPTCWQNGIAATGQYQNQLQFFAIDVEADPGIPASFTMVNGIKNFGIRPLIYTNSRDWPAIEGAQANNYSGLSLWEYSPTTLSFDNWQPNYLAPAPAAFGGWNTPKNPRIAVQQQIEYSFNGINIDLDSFDANFLH